MYDRLPLQSHSVTVLWLVPIILLTTDRQRGRWTKDSGWEQNSWSFLPRV